jgi:8-amino-7-oxononanoate synthase
MTPSLRKRTTERLLEIETEGLTRRLTSPCGIDLSSNDYLGLANDERLKSAAITAIEADGLGSTGSRLLRGERESFAQVERAFANWKGTERSLFFSSGYQANVGLLTTFVENKDIVFSDELNHASLIDGIRLAKAKRVIFNHRDVDGLARFLRNCSPTGQKFLVTESLFSMDGDIAPLDKYAEICRETNTALIVDEAHAVGVFGREGSGLIEECGIASDVFLSMNTAGKALGVSGAFVAGQEWAIEYLIQKARPFIFSTAPLPAIPAALLASIDIVRRQDERREELCKLSRFFRRLLKENEFAIASDILQDRSHIVPINIGDNERASRIACKLQSLGYDVRAIRPPTVADGTARLRISLNVSLDEDTLWAFTQHLRQVIDAN